MSIIEIGLLASLLAGLMTGVGALPAFFLTNIPDKLINTLLGGGSRRDAGRHIIFIDCSGN